MAGFLPKLISDVKSKGMAKSAASAPEHIPTNGSPRSIFGIKLGNARRGTPTPTSPRPLIKKPIISASASTPRAPEMAPAFTKGPYPEQTGEMSGIPVMHKGGKVKKTGLALLKKGETVRTSAQEKDVQKKLGKVKPSAIMAKEESDKISSLPITAAPVAYFVRHGDTDMNDDNVFRGDYDPPLNPHGQSQAKLLVHFFHNVNPIAIYHSSRLRTKQSIEPIAKSKNLKPALTKDLDSLNTGDFAGKPKDEENKKKMKWYREHPDARIPGGQTVREFQEEADAAFARLLREGDNKEGKPVIAAVHGSIVKELGRYLHGDIKAAHVEPGGVVGVYKLPSGAYVAKPLLDENHGDDELDLDS